ncbi:hypothetical protein LSUE1_G000192 [Lachnellula suecica]|uniref:GPI anchored protein n=1 Tax=Lachnellula suecica TaxID=602035 RepID=A0A8T9CHK5_9HELO|nr:hypothetical protein LSUE1_G000192 [Lachnellula suecica]
MLTVRIFRLDKEHWLTQAIDTSILKGGRTRVAKTLMDYKLPALILEDIEASLVDIQCSDSAVMVEFAESEMLTAARESWRNVSEFLVISSHSGCNRDGERSPYLVSGVTYDHEKLTANFDAQRVQWKGSYHSMTVKFGVSNTRYRSDSLRTHEGLRRRQVAPSTTSTAVVATTTPNTNTSAHARIDFQVPADEEIFSFSNTAGAVTDSASVKCKDCSISGTIDIVEGEITLSNSTTALGEAVDFINTGYFRAVANNMSAHIELDTSLDLSITQSFNKSFPAIGIPGFQIPGIATIGPFFQPVITGSLQMQGSVDFTYGFDMKVPDNSSILLNVGNLNESSSQGLYISLPRRCSKTYQTLSDNAQISAIPLSASSPSIALTLGLGLRAELDLGINILSGDGSMAAGAFIDLPSLTVTISNLAGVNKQCEPITNITTADQILSHVFPNLTHIVPEVGINIGLQVGAALNIADVHTSIGSQTVLAGTTFTMPTACLSYDASNKAFVSPTVTSSTTSIALTGTGASVSETGTANPESAKAKSSGKRNGNNPLAGEGAFWWTGCMLLSVFLVALSL